MLNQYRIAIATMILVLGDVGLAQVTGVARITRIRGGALSLGGRVNSLCTLGFLPALPTLSPELRLFEKRKGKGGGTFLNNHPAAESLL